MFNRHKRFISQCLGGVKARCLDAAVSFRTVSGVSKVGVAWGRNWSTATALFFIKWSKKLHQGELHHPRLVLSASTQKREQNGTQTCEGGEEWKILKMKKNMCLFHCMGGNQLLLGFLGDARQQISCIDFGWHPPPSIFSRNGWKRKATNVWPTSAQCLWHRQGCFAAYVFHALQWHVAATNISWAGDEWKRY